MILSCCGEEAAIKLFITLNDILQLKQHGYNVVALTVNG